MGIGLESYSELLSGWMTISRRSLDSVLMPRF
jgi:hypothetical protein